MNEEIQEQPEVEAPSAAPEAAPEKSTQEKLSELLGQLVGLTDGNRTIFGALEPHNEFFHVQGNGFSPYGVKEIVPIEAPESVNRVRAVIKV